MATELGRWVTYGEVKECQVKTKYFLFQKTYAHQTFQGADI